MSQPIRVLILEDSVTDAELEVRGLRHAGFEPEWTVVETEEDFLRNLHGGVDLVLSDNNMPRMHAFRALELLKESGLDIPFIIISGTIGEETAVEAMRLGAADYLLKDRLGRLGPAVKAVLDRHRLQRERIAAEQILEESERRFREMLENMELIAMMLDRQANVTFCNDHLLRITGWEHDGVIGSNWFAKFVPQSDVDRRELFFSNVESGSLPQHDDNVILTRNGETRQILWNNTILRDSEGRVTGVACIGEDVTDRREAEMARLASDERFRQIAENIQEVFWMADEKTEEMLYVSPAYATIWGRSCESLYKEPRSWIDAIHTEDRERVQRAVVEKRAAGNFDETYRILRPDGEVRWIRDRAFPVRDQDGRIHRYVGTAEDVTERKTLEEQFLRAQRLESIGMLAAGIAHDLNNVLSPVLMATPMIREHMSNPDDLAMLATVEASAKRGAALVKQILSFAHGIGGDHVIVQAKHILGDVAGIIRETFPKNIRLEMSFPKDIWTVIGNPTQIHQVLLNLCVNARDAMPAGGLLRIRGGNVSLDADGASALPGARPGTWLVLSVEDTGTGIEPGVLAHIWEPFFTTKTADKGTGIGLSTVRGIVGTHKGFVTLATEPGKGTKFQVFLPATDAVGGADEANIRDMVKTIVSRNGYRVLAAEDGVEAVAMLAAMPCAIDVVVTDLMMPRLGGRALIEVIRRMYPKVKVLAISGGSRDSDAIQGAIDLADVFLMKPFTMEDLLTHIHDLLHPRAPTS